MFKTFLAHIGLHHTPNAIICVYYADGVRGVAEQFGLQNSTVRVRPRKGLLWELVFDSYLFTSVKPHSILTKSPNGFLDSILSIHCYTHCAWAGGTFFPVVPLCQFFGCGGKMFLVLLPYLNDRQMTPCGYPNFNSYMKNLGVLVFMTNREINPVWASLTSFLQVNQGNRIISNDEQGEI
jgi:hypothetical protein